MKYPLAILSTAVVLLNSCLFNAPIFDKGFEKPDSSLAGVWVTNEKPKDARKAEFAVCAQTGDRLILHYPAGASASDGGIYYEARQVTLHGRVLLQLRIVATFKEGIPSPSDKNWTLAWVERKDKDTLMVRALKGEDAINPDAASVRKALEAGADGWESRFGEPQKFERLPAPEAN